MAGVHPTGAGRLVLLCVGTCGCVDGSCCNAPGFGAGTCVARAQLDQACVSGASWGDPCEAGLACTPLPSDGGSPLASCVASP